MVRTPDSHQESGGGWGNHRPSARISLAITWHGMARTVLSELKQHLGKAVTLLLCSSSKNKVERGALALVPDIRGAGFAYGLHCPLLPPLPGEASTSSSR